MSGFNFVVSALVLISFIGVLFTLYKKGDENAFIKMFILAALALAVSVFFGGIGIIFGRL